MTATPVPERMRVLRMRGDGAVEVEEGPLPVLGDGDVLVRIEASAICGSERAAVRDGMPGNAGHEACGVVVHASGEAPAVGRRVGISAIRGCGTCPACLQGIETRCAVGPRIQVGLHAEYAAVGASTLRQLPDGADASTGALLSGDALGVPVRALRRAPSERGDLVVVIGLGPVGLAHVAVRAHLGCEVIGIEPSPARRALALDLGAAGALDPDETPPLAALVIEATGMPANIERAFELARPGGTVLQSGECAVATVRPSAMVVHREITYTGAWYYATEDYPRMLELERGGLRIRRLVTDEIDAGDAQSAFDRFFSAQSGKVILRWG